MRPLIVSKPFGLHLETLVLADVVQPRVPADQQAVVVERFDVEVFLAAGQRVADDLLDDVRQGHDAFRAAVFVHDHRQPLPTREKRAHQVEGAHGFRDVGGRVHDFRVMRHVLRARRPGQPVRGNRRTSSTPTMSSVVSP